MADQWSVKRFACNIASGTFAYKRLLQGMSRHVYAFSCFMREYLDPIVATDHFAQNVDVIWIPANNFIFGSYMEHPDTLQMHSLGKIEIGKKSANLETDKLNSLAELYHGTKVHHKLGKSKNFSAETDSPSQERHYSAT